MSGPAAKTQVESIEARLALARAAFARHYAMCFWSWPPDTTLTSELLPNVAHALRSHGGREQVILAEKICPSTLYSRRYLPCYVRGETPTAT